MFVNPIRLPAVADRLVQYLDRHAIQMFTDLAPPSMPADEAAQMAAKTVAVLAGTLVTPECGLKWISDEFSALVSEAAEDLPDLILTADELTEPHGLIVFDTCLPGQAPVRAISWSSVTGEDGSDGVWVVPYLDAVETVRGHMGRDEAREKFGWLIPGGNGSFLQFNTRLPHTEWAQAVLRPLIAVMILIGQPGVADVEEPPRDKSTARKYNRAGRPYPLVRVVNLRRRPVPEDLETTGPGTGRKLTERIRVKGHYRWQRYGKNRSEVNRIYIARHWRGPKGAPVKAGMTRTVHTLT